MENSTPVNPSPSEVEASDSSEELESDDDRSPRIFVRSDRNVPTIAATQETSEEEGEEESESESQGKAAQIKSGAGDDSSERESESESDTGSQLQGASPKSTLVQTQKAMVNGGPKKAAVSSPLHQKPLRQGQKDEPSSKKGKVETLKRDRHDNSEKNDYFRKRNKGSTENVSAGEISRSQAISKGVSHILKAGNEKQPSAQHLDRKTAGETAVQAVSHDKKHSSKQRTEENRNSRTKISGKGNRLENGSEKNGYKAENVLNYSESCDAKEPVSPQKPKKSPQNWTSKDEVLLSSGILNCVKLGSEIPSKKTDSFWGQLAEQLEGKLEVERTKEQLCEKLKRMRRRYHTMAAKIKGSQRPYKHRKSNDELLFSLWKQIWDKVDAHKLEDTEELDGLKEGPSKSVVAAAKKRSTKERKLELDAANGQNSRKKQSGVKGSEREESGASERNGTTSMPKEVDRKGTPATAAKALHDRNSKLFSDVAVMPLGAMGPNVQDDGRLSHFSSEIHKLLQDGMRASLSEMQEASKVMLEEWLSSVKTVFESAIKAIADKSSLMNGMGVTRIGGTPFRTWDLMDFHLPHGEQAYPQQWYELHLQELDIYSQRLQLMLRECHLKQEQLKLEIEKGK